VRVHDRQPVPAGLTEVVYEAAKEEAVQCHERAPQAKIEPRQVIVRSKIGREERSEDERKRKVFIGFQDFKDEDEVQLPAGNRIPAIVLILLILFKIGLESQHAWGCHASAFAPGPSTLPTPNALDKASAVLNPGCLQHSKQVVC
jgi:hypothetical protein